MFQLKPVYVGPVRTAVAGLAVRPVVARLLEVGPVIEFAFAGTFRPAVPCGDAQGLLPFVGRRLLRASVGRQLRPPPRPPELPPRPRGFSAAAARASATSARISATSAPRLRHLGPRLRPRHGNHDGLSRRSRRRGHADQRAGRIVAAVLGQTVTHVVDEHQQDELLLSPPQCVVGRIGTGHVRQQHGLGGGEDPRDAVLRGRIPERIGLVDGRGEAGQVRSPGGSCRRVAG